MMLHTTALVAGLQLLSVVSLTRAQGLGQFSADAAVALDGGASGESAGQPNVRNNAAGATSGGSLLDGAQFNIFALERQNLIPVDSYIRTCPCSTPSTVRVDDIRDISDQFCAGGNAKSTVGHSNMVWGFGQFLDHDLALTIEDERSAGLGIDTHEDVMELHRAVTAGGSGCKNTLNVHTALVDAGPVYGSDEVYTKFTLREPGTCRLRTAEGGFLPITTAADDEGRFFMLAGDVRVSEHAFLAAQHTVWMREHNRLCAEVEAHPEHGQMTADAQFDLVRDVVIAKFQQVVLEEFLPALGITKRDVELARRRSSMPGVSMEFSIAYRLGHDLIANDVGGMDMTDAFNAEDFFLDVSGSTFAPSVTYKANAESMLTNIMTKLSTTKANEIDGKLSDALRNNLFGHSEGQDLAGRNIFRGRDLGIPTYAGLAECFGIEPDETVAQETPDAWLGLLREPKPAGQPLPPTLRAIIIEQFNRSIFGPGGFYWKWEMDKVASFVDEITSSTYAKIISANTGASVSGNVFEA